MQYATSKLRSPVKWHGGKSYLSRRIIGLMPESKDYFEPFAGGLNVLLNRPKAPGKEIACDLNEDLIEVWTVIRDSHEWLQGVLARVPYCLNSFQMAKERLHASPLSRCRYLGTRGHASICRAADILIVNRMSRGGLGRDFAWSNRPRGGQPGDVNAWKTMIGSLPAIAERIRNVSFFSGDVIRTPMDNYLNHDTVVYCDPPYPPETRTSPDVYLHEMGLKEHLDLLNMVQRCRAKVFLSGYDCPLYNYVLRHWVRHEFEMPNHAGQGATKQRRIEVVWEKPD